MANGYGLGQATYGLARGVQDANRDRREEEAFQGDQAIRRERLKQEQDLAPDRKRLLGAEADRSQAIARAAPEQLDQEAESREQLAAQREREAQQAEQAQRDAETRKQLGIALGSVHGGGDPQQVADWLNTNRPDKNGVKAGARRAPNGDIQLFSVGPDGAEKPLHVFKHNEEIGGEKRTAEEQLGMYMHKAFDPLGAAAEQGKTDAKIRAEAEKQAEITNRALLRRVQDAERRSSALATSHERLAKSYIDSSLKTTQIPGSFAATFSNEDDAKLVPVYYKEMSKNLDAGKSPAEAAQAAIENVRVRYNTAKKAAMSAAKKLAEAGVDPRDPAALAKARTTNPAVEDYAKALGAIKSEFGDDIGQYTMGLAPRPKR